MADTMEEGGTSSGIDRSADERLEITTSKDVSVHPTFASMSLKGTPAPLPGPARDSYYQIFGVLT